MQYIIRKAINNTSVKNYYSRGIVFLNYQEEPKKALGRYIGQEDKGDVEDKCYAQAIEMNDGRKLNALFDKNGFELRDWPTKVKNFHDEKEVKSIYYDEIVELVKAATGASLVLVFDSTIRETSQINLNALDGGSAAPVQRVHSDYTEQSAPRRLEQLVRKDEFFGIKSVPRSLLHCDYTFVNVWRSIDQNNVIKRRPLAVLDKNSVDHSKDTMIYELRFPDRTGQTYSLRYNKNHQWYYFPQMTAHECLIFNNFDKRSKFSGVFHTAFDDPNTKARDPPRRSIEVRTVAFFPPRENLDKPNHYTFYDMAHSNNAARIRLWLQLDQWQHKNQHIIQTKLVQYPQLQSSEFAIINPLRKIPALVKPNNETVFESDVILRYLEDKFGQSKRFTPSTPDDRQRMELIIRCHDLYIASPNNTQPGFSHTQGAMYLSAAFHGPHRAMSVSDRAAKLKELWSQLVWLDKYLIGTPYLVSNSLSLADLTWYPTCVFMEFMLPRVFDWPQLFYHPRNNNEHHSPVPRLARWFSFLTSQHDAFASTRNTILEYWHKMDADPHRQFDPIIDEIKQNPHLKWKYP
uniref:GST N-terminal domain-containing protein n=1 Tax=Aureoumbra lagunensis TaxID=44058 RepID=A0A7S3JSX8_9STRA|mmetsp:Transcript_21874/g.33678  ORF Transcript_21874/g.33678 Transcript_21874/m.33678 type:complete len:574 (+) Transcript_21874:117-1838(+)